MTTQEKTASGESPLSADEAEAAADAFRPSWAADDGDDAGPPAIPPSNGAGGVTAPAPVIIIGAPVISVSNGNPIPGAPLPLVAKTGLSESNPPVDESRTSPPFGASGLT